MALKMKKGNQWVELPDSLQPKLPPSGVIAEYRFTESYPEIMKGPSGEVRHQNTFKNQIALPPIFQVRHEGHFVTLGIVGGYDNQGNPNAGEVRQLSFEPRAHGGVLYVNPELDQSSLELYEALELHPMVADNSNPDTATEKVIRKVDNVGEAQKSRENRATRREAMKLASSLEGEQLERAALLLNLSHIKNEDQLLNAIEDVAESNPEHFNMVLNDKNGDIIATFRKGLSLGAIFIDPPAKQIKWKNKNQFLAINSNPTDINAVTDEYVNHANTDAGSRLNTQLEGVVKMEEKKASKESTSTVPANTATTGIDADSKGKIGSGRSGSKE